MERKTLKEFSMRKLKHLFLALSLLSPAMVQSASANTQKSTQKASTATKAPAAKKAEEVTHLNMRAERKYSYSDLRSLQLISYTELDEEMKGHFNNLFYYKGFRNIVLAEGKSQTEKDQAIAYFTQLSEQKNDPVGYLVVGSYYRLAAEKTNEHFKLSNPYTQKKVEVLTKCAEKFGNQCKPAYAEIAQVYEGSGNNAKFIEWIKKGTAVDNKFCKYELSWAFRLGKLGLPHSYEESYKALRGSGYSFQHEPHPYWAMNGSGYDTSWERYQSGLHQFMGWGTPKNWDWAFQNFYYGKAWDKRDLGNAAPQNNMMLGLMYSLPNSPKSDLKKMYEVTSVCADMGEGTCIYMKGRQLYDGVGVPENKPEAVKLLREAVKLGVTDAADYMKQKKIS